MKTLFSNAQTPCFMSVIYEVGWTHLSFILITVGLNTLVTAIIGNIVSWNYELKKDKKHQKSTSCTMYIISEFVWIDVLFISVGVVANSIVITIIVYFIAKLYRLKKIRMALVKKTCPEASNSIILKSDQAQPFINPYQFEMDREAIQEKRIQFIKKISSGSYGDVYEGLLKENETKIYIKHASKNSSELQKTLLVEELNSMRNIKPHPNILCFVGVVLFNKKLPYTIFEYVEHVNLLDYLRQNRETIIDTDLLSLTYQIANGMKYLASILERKTHMFFGSNSTFLTIQVIHRDLDLWNISLTSDKIIRIGGFGLAGFDREEYYIREITKDAPFSARLLSPESFQNWEFTEKSDVWAFAVCLFELFSFGEVTAYEGVDDIQKFLIEGKRLPRPEHCNLQIYTLMLSCWNTDPAIRPTFSSCTYFFAKLLGPQITIMDKLFSKDGFITKMTEALPGGGFITAPIHAAAGNSTHAVKAAIAGLGTLSATVIAGPAGAYGASVGTAGLSAVMDNYGPENH